MSLEETKPPILGLLPFQVSRCRVGALRFVSQDGVQGKGRRMSPFPAQHAVTNGFTPSSSV